MNARKLLIPPPPATPQYHRTLRWTFQVKASYVAPMKIAAALFAALITLFFTPASLPAAEDLLYLAAGDEISVFTIDTTTGKLTPTQTNPLPGAGPFTFSPDQSHLYIMAAGDQKGAATMATFDVLDDGTLKQAHSAPVNLRAGYLKSDATNSVIAGNHYGPGQATVWKLDDGVYKGATLQELTLEPKAHSAVFSPDNQWLLVPATEPNKVFVNRFDPTTGTVTPNDPPAGIGPQKESDARQPRHLVFHPSKPVVYTTNERELPGVGVWSWDTDKGTLETVQNIVTLPENFDGSITTADLHLTPDARFLYVSNRDGTDRNSPTGKDSIVGFKVDPDSGHLTLIGHNPCERVPRSFTIHPSGKYLYVAGQGDSRLGVYAINPDTGILTKIEQHETGTRPIWVQALSFD